MNRIAVLGLGLMGASIGLALRKAGFAGRIAGYARRPDVREAALARGVADEVFDCAAEAVHGADLSVMCVPIFSMRPLFESLRGALKPESLCTDVGSTKRLLRDELEPLAESCGARFIGSHPIAGSEQSGIEAARADLYQGALTVVVPGGHSPQPAVEAIEAFWSRLGSRTLRMTAEEHDSVLARTSHLPHMVSSLLAETVGREGDASIRLGPFCGSGFRDTSRVAEGSPPVWVDIARSNAEPLIAELEAYRGRLEALLSDLRKGRFESVRTRLEVAQSNRRALMQARQFKEADE